MNALANHPQLAGIGKPWPHLFVAPGNPLSAYVIPVPTRQLNDYGRSTRTITCVLMRMHAKERGHLATFHLN